MPSGYPHSRAVRWRLFDQVCLGVPFGGRRRTWACRRRSIIWWRDAGAMKLVWGEAAGSLILGTCR